LLDKTAAATNWRRRRTGRRRCSARPAAQGQGEAWGGGARERGRLVRTTFIGHDAGCPCVHAKDGGRGLPWWPWPPMAGLRWASCGLAAGPGEMGRAFGLGPNRKDKICFFSKHFSVQKQIQKMPRKCLEARKYPENHKNSRKIPKGRLKYEQSK
jgi:hypothetical protein